MSSFDLVLFERSYFSRYNETDAMVSLRCNKTNELLHCIPTGLTVTQSIGLLSPVVIATFIDLNGDLFNNVKPDASDVFLLKFAKSDNEVVEMRLKMVNVELTGTVLGSTGNIEFRVTFMGENWFEMNTVCKSRGWSNALLSNVVSDIASEGMYSELKIHPTSKRQGSIVQPNRTNKEMLNWVIDNAFSDANDGNYLFGVNLDGQFFFKNIERHITEYRPRMRNGDIITFELFSPSLNESETLAKKKDNVVVPAYFVGFSSEINYQKSVSELGMGVNAAYFDFETGKYKKSRVTVSNTDISSLSDVVGLYQEHTTSPKTVYLGTDVDCNKKLRARMAKNINNVLPIKIMTEGSTNVSIFDVVALDVNNTSQMSITTKNLLYSGFYLVKNVVTSFSFKESVAVSSSLTLVRQGYNRNSLDQFDNMVETGRGRL